MTGRSSTEIVAEAVGAIGPYKAWLTAKRGEIQGQIAQMQTASGAAATGTHDSPLTARLRRVVASGTSTMPPAESAALSADLHNPLGGAGDPTTDAAHTVDVADMVQATHSAATGAPETPVGSQASATAMSATASVAALPTFQNQQEAQANLDTVFAATPPHTLPPHVVTAWAGRTADATYNARMLIGAQEAGVLPAELAHAVSAMIAFDSEFGAVYQLYEGGLYKELFDIGIGEPGPNEKEDDTDEEEQDEDSDVDEEEEEGDEQEAERERHWGFPGEDQHESPF